MIFVQHKSNIKHDDTFVRVQNFIFGFHIYVSPREIKNYITFDFEVFLIFFTGF
jgi:hypothetical protein